MSPLLFAATLAAAQGAQSGPPPGDWVLFFTHSEGSISFYDQDSVLREGAKARVFARWDRSQVSGSPFYEARLLEEVDCTARTVQILAIISYDRAGAEIHRTGEAPAAPVQPRTVGAALYRQLCRNQAAGR